ncbi:MAG: laccase domain-containing protein, partial [Acidobacteria bacterium]|nr:laccase domain-containing protein [Acidobacteriota bacterium]
AAHAGWRGVSLGIPADLVREMAQGFGCPPDRLLVGIGPAVGPCCYEVGPELRAVFRRRGRDPEAGDFRPGPDGRLRLDLVGAVRRQLREEGVPPGNVEAVGLCTACRPDLLFSRRRDGPGQDRLHAFIGWRALPAGPA